MARAVQTVLDMKIAFATTDGEHVHGELRRSPLVVIYEVTPAGSQLERASAFRDHVARSEDRIGALGGAAIVYVAAIGPSTAARLAARGIQPATAPEGTPIRDLLAAAARALAGARDEELAFA